VVETSLRRAGLWPEVNQRLRMLAGPTEQVFGQPADQRTADYVHGRFG
jgi:ABC-type phosphate transport system ATPase subunit